MSQRTVKYKKTGIFAVHQCAGPRISCVTGDIATINDDHAEKLVRAGWAEYTGEQQPSTTAPQAVAENVADVSTGEQQPADNRPVKTILEELIAGKEESEQKQIIKQYGIDHFNVSVSKQKSVENMISDICEAAAAE